MSAVSSPRCFSSAITSALVRGLASSACMCPTSSGKLTPSNDVRFSLWNDEKLSDSAICVSSWRTVRVPGRRREVVFRLGNLFRNLDRVLAYRAIRAGEVLCLRRQFMVSLHL